MCRNKEMAALEANNTRRFTKPQCEQTELGGGGGETRENCLLSD